MNLLEAKRQLRAAVRAGNSLLLESSSGLGKSSMCIQEFERIKDEDAKRGISWGLGTIFAATQTPPDLIGYQYKGEKDFGDGRQVPLSVATCPLWAISVPHGDDPGGKPMWMYDRYYLIIEEYGQGEADVKRALAEVFLSHGTPPWYMPPGSFVVGCTNTGTRYGVSKDFDFCINRRQLIHINGDIEVSLKYFDRPYQFNMREWTALPITKAWAATHPEIVFEAEPKEQGPWCTPRSLLAADRHVQVLAEDNGGEIPVNDPALIESVAGIIGMPATQSYCGHMQFRLELPAFEDIEANPEKTPIPTRPDLLLLLSYELASYTKQASLPSTIKYMSRKEMPKDMQVTFVSALLRRDYKGLINEPAMQGWIAKNSALVAIISSLS